MSQERSDPQDPRLIRGACSLKPFDAVLHALVCSDNRAVHLVARPTFVWKGRLESIFKV